MNHSEETKPGYDLGHPASVKSLVGVFGALLVLTVLTVLVAQHDLGKADLSIAMLIATVKATLVAWFFMHLNHDKGVNRLAFLTALIFAGLFLAVTLGDGFFYDSDMTTYAADQALLK
jgi:cytochrome c oxidase subunit 4